jgi:hypothetical protein
MPKLAMKVGALERICAATAALVVTLVAVWGAAMLAYPPEAVSLAARPAVPSAATMHPRVRG